MQQVAGVTVPTPSSGYAGYLMAHRLEDGRYRVELRPNGAETAAVYVLDVSAEMMTDFVCAVLDDLPKESVTIDAD